MGLFLLPLVFLAARIYDAYDNKKGNEAYRKLKEEQKWRGY